MTPKHLLHELASSSVGSEVDVIGQGFGMRKPRVYLGGKKCKVLEWSDTSILCQVRNTLMPAVPYDVEFRPRGSESIVEEGGFTIMPPEIVSVSPESDLSESFVTVTGSFFGTNRGRVYLEDENGVKKRCSVKKADWSMNSIKFKVPRRLSGKCDLTVTNRVGSHTMTDCFTAE